MRDWRFLGLKLWGGRGGNVGVGDDDDGGDDDDNEAMDHHLLVIALIELTEVLYMVLGHLLCQSLWMASSSSS